MVSESTTTPPNPPTESLNPCFGGIWSLSIIRLVARHQEKKGLNPCFGGIWSLRQKKFIAVPKRTRLNPCFGGIWSLSAKQECLNIRRNKCLNPCFGGIWSLSRTHSTDDEKIDKVLILVLVGYGL